ncbi:uncharacterized protein [Magallana gigas]|uniref:uncharacterized protein n=1 Tax=Magallana gigas TaxID=29159 RepID=UPI00334089F1
MRCVFRRCRRRLIARRRRRYETRPKEEIEMGLRPGWYAPPPPPPPRVGPSAPPWEAGATVQTARATSAQVAPWPTPRAGPTPPARGGGRYHFHSAKRARTE